MLAKPHRWADYLEYDEKSYSRLRDDTPEEIKNEYEEYKKRKQKAFREEEIIY